MYRLFVVLKHIRRKVLLVLEKEQAIGACRSAAVCGLGYGNSR